MKHTYGGAALKHVTYMLEYRGTREGFSTEVHMVSGQSFISKYTFKEWLHAMEAYHENMTRRAFGRHVETPALRAFLSSGSHYCSALARAELMGLLNNE